jgi:hypothetical protein
MFAKLTLGKLQCRRPSLFWGEDKTNILSSVGSFVKQNAVRLCDCLLQQSFGVTCFGRNVHEEETGEENWTKISEM